MTPQDIARAQELRDRGWSWKSIACEMGIGKYVIRTAIDSQFSRRYKPYEPVAGGRILRVDRFGPRGSINPIYDPKRDGPREHDSLSAVIMGDPPVGQRAIDGMPRHGAEKPAHALFGPERISAASARNNSPESPLWASEGYD